MSLPLLEYGADGPILCTNKLRQPYRSLSPASSKKIRQRPPPNTNDVRFHNKSFVAKRGYALPLRCYLHGDTLNVLWTALRDTRERLMCLNREQQFRRTCRSLTSVENRLHDLADQKSRRPYWPTFALLVREMRKLYYEKVDLLLTIVRDTHMNPVVKASDLQRAMAPAFTTEQHRRRSFCDGLDRCEREARDSLRRATNSKSELVSRTRNARSTAMDQVGQSVSARDRRSRGLKVIDRSADIARRVETYSSYSHAATQRCRVAKRPRGAAGTVRRLRVHSSIELR